MILRRATVTGDIVVRSRHLITAGCIQACNHDAMSAKRHVDERRLAAEQEGDRLTAIYNRHLRNLEAARDALRAWIVENLNDGPLGPADLARHSPYEVGHIQRIRRDEKIPPRREPTVIRRPDSED